MLYVFNVSNWDLESVFLDAEIRIYVIQTNLDLEHIKPHC